MSCSGTVGKTVIFNGKDSYFQDSNIVWLDNDELVVKNSLLYYIVNKFSWSELSSTTIKRIYSSDIKTKKILTSILIDEQEKIAKFLSTLDKRIELQEKLIEKLEEEKKGYLQKLFPKKGKSIPELRFEEFNEAGEWEKKILRELTVKMQSGGTPKSTEERYYNGKIPFMSISDIDNNKLRDTSKRITIDALNESSTNIVKSDNLIYTMYATPGVAFINEIDVAIPQSVISIILKKEYSKVFIMELLNKEREKILNFGMTGTQTNLTGEIVKNLNIHIPEQHEMDAIARKLTLLEKNIQLSKDSVKILKDIKKYYTYNILI